MSVEPVLEGDGHLNETQTLSSGNSHFTVQKTSDCHSEKMLSGCVWTFLDPVGTPRFCFFLLEDLHCKILLNKI